RGDQLRPAALQLAGDGDRCRPHLVGIPSRLERDIDMESAVPRRLRVPDDSELVQQSVDFDRGAPHLFEADARLRVEIEAQLVGYVRAVMAMRPEVKAEACEVHV